MTAPFLVRCCLGAIACASGCTWSLCWAEEPAAVDEPTANSAAVVIVEHARFTVLTPELIRMEWSADGRFEDRASLVFINRRLPVPRFQHVIADDKSKV